MNPFDYLKAINMDKKDVMVDDVTEKGYAPYVVNKSLSYFADTVAMANAMNMHHQLDKKLQFHFLLNIVRRRKRFSKWAKPTISNDIDAVKEYYGYSSAKANSALRLLTDDQIIEIKKRISKGGRN
tara:strand:- start:12410 stop:12787 length:378 start_codon:yes stop_codon:yes gene_type:complete